MKKLLCIVLNLFSLVYLSDNTLLAQTKSENLITTSVPFLRINSDARAGAMGSAAIATSADVNSVYWNIGKLSFADKHTSIGVNYSPWLHEWSRDMYIANVTGYIKLNENEALYGLVNYFNPGDLQFTDNNGNQLYTYHPNEFGVNVGYSRKLSAKIGLGIGLKYIRSNLANGMQNGFDFKAGNAIAADIGLYYKLNERGNSSWAFGATLSNLGSKISYTNNDDQKNFIPANLGLGSTYTKIFDEQNKIVFALDINKLLVPTPPSDSMELTNYKNKSVTSSWLSSLSDAPGGLSEELKECQIAAGAEYGYNDQFFARTGYFFEEKSKGNRTYFSAGAGVRYNFFTINFAYLVPNAKGVSKNPLANTLQFSLIINFENEKQ